MREKIESGIAVRFEDPEGREHWGLWVDNVLEHSVYAVGMYGPATVALVLVDTKLKTVPFSRLKLSPQLPRHKAPGQY